MIKCTEVYYNNSSLLMKMECPIFINLDKVKYFSISDKKFNDKTIYNLRFVDGDYKAVISEELDKQFKLD